MSDATADRGATPNASDLSEVFVRYQAAVQAYIYNRLGRSDWHLAEDLTSETFLQLYRSYTAQGRALDGRVASLLATVARQKIARHFGVARNTEIPADFTEYAEVRHLPVSHSAEDWAVENLTRDAMLAGHPVPLGVAA